MRAAKISIGDVFGRLTVTAAAGRSRSRKLLWLVRCECGEARVIPADRLRSGATRSCGCLHRDVLRTHGLWGHPLYKLWNSMRSRCLQPSHMNYRRYGGRGITICERWSDFANFVADVGPRPSPEHSLDRIDNDGPYSPENCRWATRGEQARNTSLCKPITFNGRTLAASEWARERGLIDRTILRRLQEGWSIEEALQPPMPRGKRRARRT